MHGVDRFLAVGGTPTVLNIHHGERRLAKLKFDASRIPRGRDAFAPQAIVIPQSETERILGDLLRERGGDIEWGMEFVDFEQDASSVFSKVRANGSDELIRSDYLVSCEGAHSVIRQQAAINFAGKTYPLAFFLADVTLAGPLHHGENHVWMHEGGSFAALSLPGPGTWRLFVDVTRTPELLANGISLDLIRKLLLERTGAGDIVISAPVWLSEFRIHCRMVDRYRNGRVLVAGDAAHVHSPTGGQGIVTGIQDATNLAWKLARVCQGSPEELLDTYQEERLPKAAEVLRETDRTTRLMLAPDPIRRLFRDLVVLPIMRNAAVQRKLFAKLAQLHVNYRGSSLSQHNDASRWKSRTTLRAGDRAPDVAFRDHRSGEIRTLFSLLEPMQPIVLAGVSLFDDKKRFNAIRAALANASIDLFIVGESSSDVAAEVICLSDCHGDFARLYGMTGDFLCLIRPDDHIGLFIRPVSDRELGTYLAKISSSRPEIGDFEIAAP